MATLRILLFNLFMSLPFSIRNAWNKRFGISQDELVGKINADMKDWE